MANDKCVKDIERNRYSVLCKQVEASQQRHLESKSELSHTLVNQFIIKAWDNRLYKQKENMYKTHEEFRILSQGSE